MDGGYHGQRNVVCAEGRRERGPTEGGDHLLRCDFCELLGDVNCGFGDDRGWDLGGRSICGKEDGSESSILPWKLVSPSIFRISWFSAAFFTAFSFLRMFPLSTDWREFSQPSNFALRTAVFQVAHVSFACRIASGAEKYFLAVFVAFLTPRLSFASSGFQHLFWVRSGLHYSSKVVVALSMAS